jgi:transcription-repair coupling factor (superfamily II helicase)
MIPGFSPERIAAAGRPLTIGAVPSGVEPLILADLARKTGPIALRAVGRPAHFRS